MWFGLAQTGEGVGHRTAGVSRGDRTGIRAATVAHAFKMIRAAL